ncbi:glycosyltransferase [Flavobacterium sp.]|jgi:glycosyltransferase involved in cell wall biosynthesis|uniref:glycosyltransferase family 2 protein n=1 Tax=Flavobacterium sp. TaxID=239 RepID=UPI0026163705|nr:glycosyltransferase [Flavobacterium sp.]
MKLSIIVPAFNAVKILENTISTAYAQKLEEHQFEVIIIDDGSNDSTYDLALSLASKRTNCIVIHQENKGLGGARNTGIKVARGTYICFLDADDFLIENSLNTLFDLASQFNLDVLEFGARGVSIAGHVIYEYKNHSSQVLDGLSYYKSIRYMNSACNKLYKRSFLLENQLFFLERIFIEDYEFNTRIFIKAEKVYATSLIGAEFVQSANSITRNKEVSKKQKMLHDIFEVISIINSDFKVVEQTQNESQKAFYLERLNFLVVTLFFQLFKMNSPIADCVFWKNKLKIQGMWYVYNSIYDRKKFVFKLLLIFFPLFLLLVFVKGNISRLFSIEN